MEGMKVNVVEEKIKIVSYVRSNGPVVAHAVGKALGINSFLSSALLSELLGDKVIISSNLRVGGSPLYYVRGQEEKLSNFTKFLGFKEREAFELLKQKVLMEDKKCDPAIRVAFRAIKDFAVPLLVSKGGEEKLFWKFYLASNEEASEKIKVLLENSDLMLIPKLVEEKKEEVKSAVEVKMPLVETKDESKSIVEEEKKEVKKTAKKKTINFPLEARDWLSSNKIKIKREISSDNKLFKAIVEVESGVGSLDFLLIAKDKKTVNEGEIALIYQEGANEKLPVLFLSNGKLTKKANEAIEGFKGRLVMRKL